MTQADMSADVDPRAAGQIVLSNGIVDVAVSTAFGPRVLVFRATGGPNVFGSAPDGPGDPRAGEWKARGGHRLWVAPELVPGTYAPDNDPIQHVTLGPLTSRFVQPVDAAGIEKQMVVALDAQSARVHVTHTITNRGPWPVFVAPWALTLVNPARRAFIPQPPVLGHADAQAPARAIVQWHYTDFTDPRWQFGRQMITLTPDAERAEPQKIGVGNRQGWCALVLDDQVFMKRFGWDAASIYPDMGCNNEIYTAGPFLEIETLGPLRLLPTGASATHVERWLLAQGLAADDEATLFTRLQQISDEDERDSPVNAL
jgi:hypothetical protein